MSEDAPDYKIPKNADRSDSLPQRLADAMGWGDRNIEIAVRANFRCEYCDRNLLSSVDAYKEWQHDHIIPQRVDEEKDKDRLNNMALSCRTCNVNFKGKWDPSYDLPDNASREELVAAVRQYVARKRTAMFAEVVKVREIVYGD